MSFSRRVFKRTVLAVITLLSITLLSTACGTGISSDPQSFPRPHPNEEADAETVDASPSDEGGDDAGVGEDVSIIGEDVASSDDRGDGLERLDRASDDTDAVRDISNDSSVDRSADAETGRDASSEITADGGADSSIDGDAVIADSGTIDVSGEASDAPKDAAGEVVTADGCSVGCGGPQLEYYVDASAPPGGDGSKETPFRTISAAVEAHMRAPTVARKAYVAAGTYDEALGEIFPLVLRGLSLEGTGADKTAIVGAGTFDHAGQGGPKNEQYMVTMVVGDRVLPTNVSRLSLRPVPPIPTRGYYGVFCDRGNATGEVVSPAGQTHLDEITVGPGFDTGVLALTSTLPVVSGCNMLMTRSTVTGGWIGVDAVGCNGAATPGPAMLEMGTDDPTSGNQVTWMQGENGMGDGVILESCVTTASFQYNTIADCSNGMSIGGNAIGADPIKPRPFVIKHNTFTRMSKIGVHEAGSFIFVDEISDNRFLDTTRAASSFERAVGLRIGYANVGKIRRNVFAGNDVGLMIDGGAEQTDVGRPGDPGENVFYCNSGVEGWLGADVIISYPPMARVGRGAYDADGGDGGDDGDDGDDSDAGDPPLPFAGNAWDHGPPRVDALESAPNGIEIGMDWAPALVFDVSGSSLVTTTCPAGRIP